MKKITQIAGKIIPLKKDDVDTDLIIPAEYLTSISKQGYGKHLFQRLRDQDPNFIFNQPQFKDANILVTQENFGCGSSREHAVWALKEAGIQAIIAISYGDIFFNNAMNNGLILIQQPEEIVNHLIQKALLDDYRINIDVTKLSAKTKDIEFNFSLNPFYQHCFTHGLDEMDYLVSHLKEIKEFKKSHIKNDFVDIHHA